MNKEISILDLVKDKEVLFEFYRSGELWYKTTDGFMFPVPIEDVGDATFLNKDKAILFMRYIRKHLEVTRLSEESIEEIRNSRSDLL